MSKNTIIKHGKSAYSALDFIRKWLVLVVFFAGSATYAFGFWTTTAIPLLNLPEKVGEIKGVLDDFGRRLNKVEHYVEDNTPEPMVAEYDTHRSFVMGDCSIDQECTAIFNARRTIYGKDCGAPVFTPFISNHFGQQHAVKSYTAPGTRALVDWTTIEIKFKPPSTAQPGKAQFFGITEFPKCGQGQNSVVRERTVLLNFDLLANTTN